MPVLADQSMMPLFAMLPPLSLPVASARTARLPAPWFAIVVPVVTETL